MPEDQHPPEPRTIDPDDADQVQRLAAELNCRPELITEAVEKVGPIRAAVVLWLAAPRA